MGKSQRTKGQVGEREIVSMLRSAGFLEARRTAPMQAQSMGHYGDVEGLPGFHIEVKRQERWSIRAWYKQAEEDADITRIPLLVVRESRGEWLAVLDFHDLLDILTGQKP